MRGADRVFADSDVINADVYFYADNYINMDAYIQPDAHRISDMDANFDKLSVRNPYAYNDAYMDTHIDKFSVQHSDIHSNRDVDSDIYINTDHNRDIHINTGSVCLHPADSGSSREYSNI